MATTRIMPLHIGKGRTVSKAVSDIIDYVENPQKTENGKLISCYGCDSRTADAEFVLAKREYITKTCLLYTSAFKDWIWKDPERRQALVQQYNEEMNSTRPREYDGSHIVFSGMNPEIQLREHQKNAIAHVLYGGNTLLAHEMCIRDRICRDCQHDLCTDVPVWAGAGTLF